MKADFATVCREKTNLSIIALFIGVGGTWKIKLLSKLCTLLVWELVQSAVTRALDLLAERLVFAEITHSTVLQDHGDSNH